LRVNAGLDSASLPAEHPARRIHASALRRRWSASARHLAPAPWGAEHFGLERSLAYLALPPAKRLAVLIDCGRGLLEEAYFIEKLGLAFSSKMALLADSTEERATHCLFAADEAVHLAQIAAFFPNPPARTQDAFLRWLSGVIAELPADGGRLLIQVLLEGWGITHYRSLARGCRVPSLRDVLASIARDEALHHRNGVALFDAARLKGRTRREASQRVRQLLDMVRAGPARVAAAVERAHGGLGVEARAALYADLRAAEHVSARLTLLNRLLNSVGAASLAG